MIILPTVLFVLALGFLFCAALGLAALTRDDDEGVMASVFAALLFGIATAIGVIVQFVLIWIAST